MTEAAVDALRSAGSGGERLYAAPPWIASSGIQGSRASPSRRPETRGGIIGAAGQPDNAGRWHRTFGSGSVPRCSQVGLGLCENAGHV